MRKLIHNGFLVLFLVFSTLATAQVKEITGKIKDEAGKGLPGASIIVKGTSIGTSSDLNGDFSISADQNSTLLFTFMGYQTVEVKVGNQTTFDISLSPDSKALDDVVVVAYGTQKKEAVTSSITTVKAA
ncbi:MAG: carboxypeptidase-like regulatory domain-containing protein, partial [Bacteroidota bacterium]